MSHNSKRPSATAAASDPSPAPPPKRRRVSRACDTCRSAKDKCDGVKPRCQRCILMHRQCTYLSPERRRGIRTGYLRTIELALGLLLDSNPVTENVLLKALAEPEGGLSDAFVDKDSAIAEALLDRWQRSEAYKAVHRLISGDENMPHIDEADGDSIEPVPRSIEPSGRGDEAGGEVTKWRKTPLLQISSPEPSFREVEVSVLKLPHRFRHYLDIYFTYSNSWLPILEEEAISQLAASYPPTGLAIHWGDQTHAPHSELWSAMAVGAALDSRQTLPLNSQAGNTNGGMSHSVLHMLLYTTARKLIPLEDGNLTKSHVRALLLLSLVKLTQNEANAAWLLIGQAVRLLLQLLKTYGGNQDAIHGQHSMVLMACFILDVLVSLALGNPSQMRSLGIQGCPDPLNAQDLPSLHGGRGGAGSSHPDLFSIPSTGPSPVASLFQQYKFARVLSQHLTPRTAGESPTPGSGAADLVESLDPMFRFCNTLVHGDLTPKAPGPMLVQAGFLAASILLSPTPAPRLIQSLVDVVGHYVSSTGAHASPPLLAVYLELATGDGRAAWLGPDERERSAALLQALKGYAVNQDTSPRPQSSAMDGLRMAPSLSIAHLTSGQTPPISHFRTGTFTNAYPRGSPDVSTPYNAFSMPSITQPIPNNTAGDTVPLHPPLSAGFESDTSAIVAPGIPEGYSMDYDAILDELSSLDYVDSNEPDPQFLANLGFAPGCELNDMLAGHFGPI